MDFQIPSTVYATRSSSYIILKSILGVKLKSLGFGAHKCQKSNVVLTNIAIDKVNKKSNDNSDSSNLLLLVSAYLAGTCLFIFHSTVLSLE